MAKSLLMGEVINVKTCFVRFGITNCSREIGRSIERKFGVILERKHQTGLTRYKVPCSWTDYSLPRTHTNRKGVKLMEAYVESQMEYKPKKRHKPSSQQSLLL